MGLDMYLSVERYVSANDYANRGDNVIFDKIIEMLEAKNFVGGFVPNVQVQVSVGYWRKANQIHQWFVDNCGRGEDDCRPYYVQREQLQELLQTCKEIKKAKHPDVANDLLPPQSGFFFGSYEIDEWYWEQIDDTIAQLEKVLTEVPEGWDFYYQASW